MNLARSTPRTLWLWFAAGWILLATAAIGCESYDSPPRVQLLGLVEGTLTDPTAPLVIAFSEPVVDASLRVRIARYQTDDEGTLLDQIPGRESELEVFFDRNPVGGDNGGFGILSEDRRTLTVELNQTLPVGPRLAVIVEPKLADDEGNETEVRTILTFGYTFKCAGAAVGDSFPTGGYFFVVDVELPIETQIQLWAYLEVDPDTGLINGQFTNADRIQDPAHCGLMCDAETEACRTVPEAACVLPSTKAVDEDEYVDFYPNDVTETAYSFTVQACVAPLPDGSIGFANIPTDVEVPQPAVTVKGINLSSAFAVDGGGVLRASGSFTANTVFLGPADSGPGSGVLTARRVPDEEIPPSIPKPPPVSSVIPVGGTGGAGGAASP
jgi:hypothetical protein